MNIEIVGTSTVNKGAELMLRAVCAERDDSLRGHRLVADHWTGSYLERAQLGLYQSLYLQRFKSFEGVPASLVPSTLRTRFGLIPEAEIDAVLDASGLAFTDAFPIQSMSLLARRFTRWRKQGKRLVLLPQGFGPFERPEVRDAFQAAAEAADLIYARDPISLQHAQSVIGDVSKLRQAPDFTHRLQPVMGERFSGERPVVGLVPNYRMIDQTDSDTSGSYGDFLSACVEGVLDHGYRVVVLIHEQKSDRELGTQLNEQFGGAIEIVDEPNPLRLKGLIAQCEFLVASRFHALVSALVQGVPCIGTGWSHKYPMLFEAYGCSSYLLSPNDDRTRVEAALHRLSDESVRADLRRGFAASLAEDRKTTTQMWADIGALLHP